MRARSIEDLQKAIVFAREKNIPYFILGGGSNTLVPDEGFLGLVIKIEHTGLEVVDKDGYTQVIISAGEVWDEFVSKMVDFGFCGLENLSSVPGTVGGAIVQNIGAYGVEMGDCVAWVEVFNTETMTIEKFSQKECSFGYRESIFKKKNALVVVRVAFELTCSKSPRIEYEEVKSSLREKENFTPTLLDVRNAIISIRAAKLPAIHIGTAGSFFKNPIISDDRCYEIKKKFPDIKKYPLPENKTKLSAAWLIENVGGFKGIRRGDAGVYDKHALILVNYGNASAKDILSLASEMKDVIKRKTGIVLEEEVVMMQ
ncbi:MAG: UDP-N-acetylmuramate dehydrogenase [Candidatus Yonathbacteria bacterium]|nr:UDP-N-acetylmuramate dehydrogenase [Candidatus Yonathbacteria bacterium]